MGFLVIRLADDKGDRDAYSEAGSSGAGGSVAG
jgi:hypothetical protein